MRLWEASRPNFNLQIDFRSHVRLWIPCPWCQCAHRVTASPACRPRGRERHADAPSPAAGALESRVRRPPRQDLELLGKMRDGKRKETALERDCATGCLADADAPVRSLPGGEEIGPSTAGPYWAVGLGERERNRRECMFHP